MRVILVFLWWGLTIKITKAYVLLSNFVPLRKWAWGQALDYLKWGSWCSYYVRTHDPRLIAHEESQQRGERFQQQTEQFTTTIERDIKEGRL